MKKIGFFAAVLLMISCAEDKSKDVVFSLKEVIQGDFKTCETNPCPEINLGYLLAEGKTEVAKKINQTLDERRIEILHVMQDQPLPTSLKSALQNFIAEYQRFQKEYPKFPAGYEVQISDEIIQRSEKKVVIKTEYYIFTGGAHGYGATNFSTFSLETGKLLSPQDLFQNLEAFTKYVEKKFRKKYEIPENQPINSTGFFFENDTFSLPNNLAILENDVVLIYNPYEAAAYARGELVLRFPKKEVEKWLNKKAQ